MSVALFRASTTKSKEMLPLEGVKVYVASHLKRDEFESILRIHKEMAIKCMGVDPTVQNLTYFGLNPIFELLPMWGTSVYPDLTFSLYEQLAILAPNIPEMYELHFAVHRPSKDDNLPRKMEIFLDALHTSKLDMVVVPDFSGGAMENYGLITYRKVELLHDDLHSVAANTQRLHDCMGATLVALGLETFLKFLPLNLKDLHVKCRVFSSLCADVTMKFIMSLSTEAQAALDGAESKLMLVDGESVVGENPASLRRLKLDATKTKDEEYLLVLLMSLKAGGVDLNLTAASNVFLMDPWWNPAVEEQAIMRIHRMGQKRTVCVRRFIVKDTVEERMQQIQARKQRMIAGALTDEEVRSARLEELKMLFR
ncbi:putative SWI/SNF-related matrix-associated actin-dependent regulator of chromatin subfamily A member 3-like protein 3 [Tanacetum coccineum]